MQIKQENDGHAVIDQLTGEEVLTCAINIGEQLLMSGAEISRVEDTIRRICAAYGIRQSHIFSIASCIIVTLETKDHKWITQTRRILSYGTDMWKLDRLNKSFPSDMFNKTTVRKDQPGICTYIKRTGLSACGPMPYLRNDSRCICDLLWRKSTGWFFCHVCGGIDPDNIVRIYRNKNESHFF